MTELLNKDRFLTCEDGVVEWIEKLKSHDCYFKSGGRIIDDISEFIERNKEDAVVFHVFWRLRGGKGGFGSLLRSFRVNRSTNQLMCRDLNGRRVATVEEEKKLRQWLAKAGDREKKKLEKKKAKIDKLKGGVSKHQFNDPEYIRQREDILEKTDDAFDDGFENFKKRRAEDVPNDSSSDSELELDEFGQPLAKKRRRTLDETKANGEESSDSENECDPELIKEIKTYFENKPVREEPTTSKKSKSTKEKTPEPEKPAKEDIEYEDLDLSKFEKMKELEVLGLDHLKHLLKVRGLKCGGSLQERASRLLTIRSLEPQNYPKHLLAAKK